MNLLRLLKYITSVKIDLIADPHVIDRHLIVNYGVMLINKKNTV